MLEKTAFALHSLLQTRRSTLVLAESCTGGLLAHCLTQYPGSSSYFLGSLVVYAERMKTKFLGVSPELLQQAGAVSAEVALAMWQGALQSSGAEWAIAITGWAGPSGGLGSQPIGTVWMAAGSLQNRRVEKYLCKGDRLAIMREASYHALALLLLLVEERVS